MSDRATQAGAPRIDTSLIHRRRPGTNNKTLRTAIGVGGGQMYQGARMLQRTASQNQAVAVADVADVLGS
jgi:hypothetical protein